MIGLVRSQIEIERISVWQQWSLVWDVVNLGLKNSNKLIIIMKNWSNDPRYSYSNEVQFKSIEKLLNFENVSF